MGLQPAPVGSEKLKEGNINQHTTANFMVFVSCLETKSQFREIGKAHFFSLGVWRKDGEGNPVYTHHSIVSLEPATAISETVLTFVPRRPHKLEFTCT